MARHDELTFSQLLSRRDCKCCHVVCWPNNRPGWSHFRWGSVITSGVMHWAAFSEWLCIPLFAFSLFLFLNYKPSFIPRFVLNATSMRGLVSSFVLMTRSRNSPTAKNKPKREERGLVKIPTESMCSGVVVQSSSGAQICRCRVCHRSEEEFLISCCLILISHLF